MVGVGAGLTSIAGDMEEMAAGFGSVFVRAKVAARVEVAGFFALTEARLRLSRFWRLKSTVTQSSMLSAGTALSTPCGSSVTVVSVTGRGENEAQRGGREEQRRQRLTGLEDELPLRDGDLVSVLEERLLGDLHSIDSGGVCL